MRRSLLRLSALVFALVILAVALRHLLAAVAPPAVVAYMTLETGLPVVIVQDLNHS